MFKLLLLALALGVSAHTLAQYDDQMKVQRINFFNAIPINSDDIVFIGNSITNGGEWQEFFPEFSIKDRGISGDNTTGVLARLHPIVIGKPAKVFLKIGTNDKPSAGNNQGIANRIGQIIDTFLIKSPTTQIYIQTVLPRANNTYIRDLNNKIGIICKNKEVPFLNVYSELKNADSTNLNPNYHNDNLHLLGTGYSRWSKFLMPYIGAKELGIEEVEKVTQITGLNHNYCNQRITEFELLKGKSTDVLFVGDDVIDCVEWNEMFRNKNVKGRGVGVTVSTSVWVNQLPEILEKKIYKPYSTVKPAKVFIYAGANDLIKNNKDATFVKTHLKMMVDFIRGESRTTEVYIQGYLPHSDETMSAKLIAANEELKALADSYDSGVTYIDLFKVFKNTASNTIQTQYTLSANALNGKGFLHWANSIYTFIDPNIIPVPVPVDPIVEMPTPLVSYQNITLNGLKPYRLPDEAFEKIKDLEEGTVVISLQTASTNPTGNQFIFAAADTTVAFNYTGAALNAKIPRIQMAPINNGEGWYSFSGATPSFASDIRLVYRATKDTKTLDMNINKTFSRIFAISTETNPSYRFIKNFNTQSSTNAFFLGGIATSDNKNKHPLTGLIKSIAIYATPLTNIQFNHLHNNWEEVTTDIPEVSTDGELGIYRDQDIIKVILAEGKMIEGIVIYNMQGQIVDRSPAVRSNRIEISTARFAKGVYLLKVQESNGAVLAKSIMF